MPKIAQLKTIDGALWARLEIDMRPEEGPVHVFTDAEIADLKARERKQVWAEIQEACCIDGDF